MKKPIILFALFFVFTGSIFSSKKAQESPQQVVDKKAKVETKTVVKEKAAELTNEEIPKDLSQKKTPKADEGKVVSKTSDLTDKQVVPSVIAPIAKISNLPKPIVKPVKPVYPTYPTLIKIPDTKAIELTRVQRQLSNILDRTQYLQKKGVYDRQQILNIMNRARIQQKILQDLKQNNGSPAKISKGKSTGLESVAQKEKLKILAEEVSSSKKELRTMEQKSKHSQDQTATNGAKAIT